MADQDAAPGLIIAGPASGVGKTVVTLSIVRALTNEGIHVAAAKVGPDYIDTAYLAAAGGEPCFNLDPWAMRLDTLAGLAGHLGRDARLIVCEGVMGLFDGAADGTGSTADLAAFTGWPVVLAVDVRGQGATVAALLRGFVAHQPGVPFAGVILNRVGSAGHREILLRAIDKAGVGLPVLGCLFRDDALSLPDRHLGLVQAREHPALEAFLDRAAAIAAGSIDLRSLRAAARRAPTGLVGARPLPPLGQHIAVARDDAFAFAYASVLAGWRAQGAETSFFSPLADQPPDGKADAVYLPGGYPELHAGRLSGNRRFLGGLREMAARGAAVFGECGGYMVMGRGLMDNSGERHEMAGLLPLETSFADRRLHLGYRRAELKSDTPLGRRGDVFTGHEFHYATVISEGPGQPLFATSDARGEEWGTAGLTDGRVAGSFIHLIDSAE